MGIKFRGGLLGPKNVAIATGVDNAADNAVESEKQKPADPENAPSKEANPGVAAADTSASSVASADSEGKELQFGVQVAEATLQVWSKWHLIAAYAIIWFINFMNAFASGSAGTLNAYVTSDFSAHSLTSTTSIISGLIPGLTKLAFSKYMDNFGRPAGLAFAVSVLTLGLILMAACSNVETYCAAQVFYNTGYTWLDFCITIFIADTSKLKNRGLMIAYASSPYLITVWVYGLACDSVVADGGIGWRWAFGIFAIIFPVICFPLWALFYLNQRKAIKAGLVHVTPHGRGIVANIVFYGREFDIIGIFLAAVGIGLFLLAFSLYPHQALEWRAPLIICFLIFGGLLIIAFVAWEKYFAPVTFLPWTLIRNPTVFFTYSLMGSIYTAWYIWDNYFYSYCIVVWSLSVQDATYIGNIYTVGATFWSIVFGIYLRHQGNLKWPAVCFGVPLTILGVGLMIHFRQPDVNIGYIVMCLIFIAFGGGTLVICEQMTVMAVSKHKDIPAILAMEGMVASMGQSIGSTVASAMWASLFPKYLRKYLPADAMANFDDIYENMDTQASYPLGSDTRIGINNAYTTTQRLMLITATCLYSTTWFSAFMWEPIDVTKIEQFNGAVMW